MKDLHPLLKKMITMSLVVLAVTFYIKSQTPN